MISSSVTRPTTNAASTMAEAKTSAPRSASRKDHGRARTNRPIKRNPSRSTVTSDSGGSGRRTDSGASDARSSAGAVMDPGMVGEGPVGRTAPWPGHHL